MNLSQKHHYLPVFYLKGFTNDDGFFYRYDYASGRVSRKQFHPKSMFFDNRNLIEVNGVVSDLPEQVYSKIDDRHAKLFSKLNQQIEPLVLDLDEKVLLLEFIVTTFWRLPSNEDLYDNEIKYKEAFLKHLGFVNKETGEIDKEVVYEMISKPAFSKTIKGLMPILMKYDKLTLEEFDKWQFVYNPSGNNICSDNPILLSNENVDNILNSDFIFPLSKHHLLLRLGKKIHRGNLPAPIMAYIQLLVFSQAKIYSISSDIKFIEAANKESKNMMKDNALFQILENEVFLENLDKEFNSKIRK